MKEQVSDVVIEVGSFWRAREGSPDPICVRRVMDLGGGRRSVSFNAAGEDGWRSCSATAFLRTYTRVDSQMPEVLRGTGRTAGVSCGRCDGDGCLYDERARKMVACMHCRETGLATGHCEVCTPLQAVGAARAKAALTLGSRRPG
jgi:hypothetical protein